MAWDWLTQPWLGRGGLLFLVKGCDGACSENNQAVLRAAGLCTLEKDAEKWKAPHFQHNSALTRVLALRLTALRESPEVRL